MKEIPFSKNWTKLNQKMFTTLRKSKKAKENETVVIFNRATGEKFFAICLMTLKYKLKEIPTTLLCVDTDATSRTKAIFEIQQFYRNKLTNETVFYLHLFQRGKFINHLEK